MKFDIGIILSITHSRLLTDIGNVYKILDYMLNDHLSTHQLPRAGRFAQKFILAQHPQLEEWCFNERINDKNWHLYLEKAETLFGKELEIDPVPDGVWTYKEPREEAQEVMPDDKIISVKI